MAMLAKKIQNSKTVAIDEAQGKLKEYADYVFADYRGLTVEQITALRSKLREKNCEFHVVKNSFTRLAFEKMKIEGVADYLIGPTAIAMSNEDTNEVAKILFDFCNEAPSFSVKGAWVENSVYDFEKIEAFSKLPGKKDLIAMIASTINAPVQKLAATLQAYVDKMQEEGGAPAAPAGEAKAEAPAAEEAKAEAPAAEEAKAEAPAPEAAAEGSAEAPAAETPAE